MAQTADLLLISYLVDFVDETKSISDEYQGDSPLNQPSENSDSPVFVSTHVSLPSVQYVVRYTESEETPSGASIVSPGLSAGSRSMDVQRSPEIGPEPQSPSRRFLPQSVSRQSYSGYESITATAAATSLDSLLSSASFSPTWPVESPQEARLIRHFVDKISCFVR